MYVDGLRVGVLGSKKLDFGDGKRVKYCEQQIKRVEPEGEFKSTMRVIIEPTITGNGLTSVRNVEGQISLRNGQVDGVSLGTMSDGTIVAVEQPFVVTGVSVATPFDTKKANYIDQSVLMATDVGYAEPCYWLSIDEP